MSYIWIDFLAVNLNSVFTVDKTFCEQMQGKKYKYRYGRRHSDITGKDIEGRI